MYSYLMNMMLNSLYYSSMCRLSSICDFDNRIKYLNKQESNLNGVNSQQEARWTYTKTVFEFDSSIIKLSDEASCLGD